MNDGLREQYEQIRTLLERRDAATVQVRYEAAALVAHVKCAGTRYGPNAIGKLAHALGRPKAGLYRDAAVAERWPPDIFEQIQRSGVHVPSWSHWIALAAIPNASQRDALLERVCREDLSVRSVRRLAGRADNARSTPTGRLRAQIRGALRRVARSAGKLGVVLGHDPVDPILRQEAVDAARTLLAVRTRLLQALEAHELTACHH
jgi:hypothetical protein